MSESWQAFRYVALRTLAVVSLACFAVSMYVIRTFRHQGGTELRVALFLNRSVPRFRLAALSWLPRLSLQVGDRRAERMRDSRQDLLCSQLSPAQLNIYELLMFHPLGTPHFLRAQEAHLDQDDMLITVRIGVARAYPIREMGYHHVVNDTVGREPLIATYRTLCHTGLVWKRMAKGLTRSFRLAGINHQSFLMRDDQTGTGGQG